MKDTVNIELTYSQIINYAMQQNFIPLIKRLVLKNTSTENYRDIEIEIKAEPGFAHTWTARVDSLPSESSVELDQAVVRLSSDFLVQLTEKTLGTLTLCLKSGGDELCCAHYDVEILPHDQWSGIRVMPELVTAYITPNHPAIAQVLFKAGKVLKIWTGSPSFTGYQSNNPNTVKLQAAALYAALRSEGIIYTVPPASFESSGQRVRLCDNVLSKKNGHLPGFKPSVCLLPGGGRASRSCHFYKRPCLCRGLAGGAMLSRVRSGRSDPSYQANGSGHS